MKITIRPYQKQDTEAAVGIINHYIVNSTAIYDYQPRTVEQQHAIFSEKLEKGFPVLVAVADEKVVGFGYYSEFRFREAYRFTVEHSVYAASDFQGKGIGRKLLEELIVLAQKQKLHTMIAVIDSENENSILFHEEFGFKTVGIIRESAYKFDRWLHSVMMQLILN